MSRELRQVVAGDLTALVAALAAALDGTGPAVEAVEAAGSPAPAPVPDEVALVVRTSGSTGEPRAVGLSAAALRASAAATERHLGGAGAWLLALPVTHVAGLQVLARGLLAGTPVTALGPGPFRAEAFVAAVRRLPAGRRCTSLVPTQLGRLLADPEAAAALAGLDAVLLGGAATPPALLADARAAGVPVVRTYGMTETCGGCVYDGRPLPGVEVALDEEDRVLLAGPVLATGYLGRPDLDATAFARRDGRRWLRTSDLGRLTHDGSGPLLEVLGRVDDVVVTGGVKVAPAAVEAVLAGLPGVGAAFVVGVPDPEWGQAVVAALVPAPGGPPPDLARVRAAVTRSLGAPAAPRRVVVLDALPERGPGKVDRRAVARLVAGSGEPPAS